MILTKKEIGYYILNSLDVLRGVAVPEEVIEAIEKIESKGLLERLRRMARLHHIIINILMNKLII